MTNLFDMAEAEAVKVRIARLTPQSERQWGKMTVAQMVAHCVAGTEMAVGNHNPPRMMIGRVLGWIIKPMALKEGAPMKKNSPTLPSLVTKSDPDLQAEKTRLCALIDRFAEGGAAVCTKHPHAFFGPLTPEEWAVLSHKHMDHHLRQFGV